MKHSIKKADGIFFHWADGIYSVGQLAHQQYFSGELLCDEEKKMCWWRFTSLLTRQRIPMNMWTMYFCKRPFRNICEANNISLVILDLDFKRVCGTNDSGPLQGRLWGYSVGVDDSSVKILEKTDNYTLHKRKDIRRKSDYLEIWGTLNTDYYFLMCIPVEGIRENVKISNEFFDLFQYHGDCTQYYFDLVAV